MFPHTPLLPPSGLIQLLFRANMSRYLSSSISLHAERLSRNCLLTFLANPPTYKISHLPSLSTQSPCAKFTSLTLGGKMQPLKNLKMKLCVSFRKHCLHF